MDLKLRSDVMNAEDTNTIYVARNLVCNGATAYDTGFKPFYGDDASADFKITIRIGSTGSNAANNVIVGCKYEATISGQQWPGFYIRYTTNNALQIGGYDYWTPTVASAVERNLYVWRTDGNWYAQIDDETVQTLSVRTAEFNQPIVIGAGVQTDGTYFRYGKCVIDYIRIEYI